MRGSIGGTTFSRGAGGNIARARKKGINVRSNGQGEARARLSYLSAHWKALTEVQRVAWRAYSTATTWTNRLGQSISINGLAAFVRTNTIALLVGSTIFEDAPTTPGLPGAIDFTAVISAGDTPDLGITEISAPMVLDTDDHYAIFFQSIPSSPGAIGRGRNMRFSDYLEGDTASPPTLPHDLIGSFTLVEGQNMTIESVYMDPEGRVSGRITKLFTITA